jgi:hypothetical protein
MRRGFSNGEIMTATTIEIFAGLLVFLALRGIWRFIEEERTQRLLEETYARSMRGRRNK